MLDAARAGDEVAFEQVVEPHRSELHAHCYRMLGSLHDAEDASQDAMLRAWRALPTVAAHTSLRAWLYKIATNTCLDTIAKRPRRVLPMDLGPPSGPHQDPGPALTESTWIEPYPDETLGVADGYAAPEARYEQRESIELAFIAALQHLPGRQRAVLILREVLGFSARETAESLETSVASVNSALQRARKSIDDRLPQQSQQATMRAVGDEAVRDLVERFVDSFERADVESIVALLSDEATFSMPPYSAWCRGRDAVGESWLMPEGPAGGLRYVPTRANGQLALGTYALDDEGARFLPIALDVLTLRGTEIVEIYAFRTPDVLRAFGLPADLPAR